MLLSMLCLEFPSAYYSLSALASDLLWLHSLYNYFEPILSEEETRSNITCEESMLPHPSMLMQDPSEVTAYIRIHASSALMPIQGTVVNNNDKMPTNFFYLIHEQECNNKDILPLHEAVSWDNSSSACIHPLSVVGTATDPVVCCPGAAASSPCCVIK